MLGRPSGGARSPRFRLLRELGRGGMGTVWLAEDVQRGERIALKRAQALSPESMRRFKREFRAVERLRHPGLVRVHELGQDEAGLFLVMEYVEGEDLARWCGLLGVPTRSTRRHRADGRTAGPRAAVRRAVLEVPPEERLQRLRRVLPALLDALGYLHEQGIVHRDLKPANVLVEADGLPKLLDFGLLAELGRPVADEIAGTAGYIAPETVRGEPPSPASDLYSLGVLLFELLAGESPFTAESAPLLMARAVTEEAPRLRTRWADVPDAVDELVAALLERDPARRPGLSDVLRVVAPDGGAAVPSLSAGRELPKRAGEGKKPARRLYGRGVEAGWLRRRIERAAMGRFVAALVVGPSGVGKTALCEAVVQEAALRGAHVLRGRARAGDHLPFGGLDEAMDDLGELLATRELPRASAARIRQLRRDAGSLLPSLAPAEDEVGDDGPGERHGATPAVALAELVALIAEQLDGGPLVLFLDDVQWLDPDAASLLRAIVARRPKRLVLLLAARPEVAVAPVAMMVESREVERLSLDGLPDHVIGRIVREAGAGEALAAPRMARLVAACEGLPILAELTGRALAERHGAGTSAEGRVEAERYLAEVVRRLGEEARRAMAVLVAADRPMSRAELAETLGVAPGTAEAVADDLLAASLAVREGVAPHESIGAGHDLVRQAVLGALPASQIRWAHQRLAERLAARPDVEPTALVHHLLGAGRQLEARRHALAAARHAEARRAWALAARMYDVALQAPELDPARRRALRRACAEALDRAGLYGESVALWHQLAGESEGPEAVEAALSEAAALIGAARFEEGWQRLQDVSRRALGRTALPAGVRRVSAAAAFLSGPRSIGAARRRADRAEERLADVQVRLGILVSYFDALEGMDWLRRAQVGFERVGAYEAAAWCDFVFAHTALFASAQRGRVPLAERYLEAAERRLARVEAPSPNLAAMPEFVRGAAALHRGAWPEARERLVRALEAIEGQGMEGTVDHTMVLSRLFQSAWFADDLAEAARWLAHMREAARGRGAAPLRHHLELGRMLLREATGQRAAVTDIGERLLARMVRGQRPTFARMQVLATALPLMGAVEQPAERLARLRAGLTEHRRFRPFGIVYAGQFAALQARLVVFAAGARPEERALRQVRRLVRIARRAPPFHTAMAERALARLRERLGAPRDEVLAGFDVAEREAERYGQRIQWALARHARGLRLGAARGGELRREAMDVLLECGASPELAGFEEETVR